MFLGDLLEFLFRFVVFLLFKESFGGAEFVETPFRVGIGLAGDFGGGSVFLKGLLTFPKDRVGTFKGTAQPQQRIRIPVQSEPGLILKEGERGRERLRIASNGFKRWKSFRVGTDLKGNWRGVQSGVEVRLPCAPIIVGPGDQLRMVRTADPCFGTFFGLSESGVDRVSGGEMFHLISDTPRIRC